MTTPDAAGPDAQFPDDAVEVGRVIGAWGIKGWIRVQPYAKDPQALFSSRRWFLRPAEAASGRAAPGGALPLPPLLRIREAREHGDVVVASVREVDDRDAAEALRGARIFIARSSFPTPDADEFYWVDLIGLEVFNRDGERLGVVSALLDNGAQSVLQIDDGDASPRLIPFVAAYVDQVDLPGRRITVDWGLDY